MTVAEAVKAEVGKTNAPALALPPALLRRYRAIRQGRGRAAQRQERAALPGPTPLATDSDLLLAMVVDKVAPRALANAVSGSGGSK